MATFSIDDLIAACSSLGKLDTRDGVYMKDRDCKSCLKEVIRDLNSDNDQHLVRSTLGELNIIDADLIPLINQYCDFNDGDTDLFNLVLRLCTNLTSSILLLYENQDIPTETEATRSYNTLSRGLFKYKEAFAKDIRIWQTLDKHLRHTEDEIPFERLLILIRNILHIPVDSTGDFGIHHAYDAHDMCLYWMEKSGLLQTLVEIASETQRGTEFCFHIMEIVYLMLRDKNPGTIASAKYNNNKRKLDDDDADKRRLAELRAREKGSKAAASRIAPPRFRGATYVVTNVSSISDAPIIRRHLMDKNEPVVMDHGKTDLRRSRNRKPFDSERSSTVLSDRDTRPTMIAYCMQTFCKLFTEKIYANYMQQIKHNLIQKKAAENDESYYLWALQFFIAFNRYMHMSYDNISETLSSSTLHFIQILINDYQDKLKTERKRSRVEKISKRLHLAIRAYREILVFIRSVKPEEEFHGITESIKKKIFTEVEYNSMLLTLFQQYDESKYCREYLKDLIKANDVFLELGTAYLSMSHYFDPNVVRAYSQVLKDFKCNSSEINMAILRYFERLAYDHNMGVMLMQASIFATLLEIIDDGHVARHEGFLKLAKNLMTKFLDLSALNGKRWMFQELLFWKSHGDVLEIEHDPQAEQVITADTVDDEVEKAQEGADDDLDGFIVDDKNDDERLSPPLDEAQPGSPGSMSWLSSPEHSNPASHHSHPNSPVPQKSPTSPICPTPPRSRTSPQSRASSKSPASPESAASPKSPGSPVLATAQALDTSEDSDSGSLPFISAGLPGSPGLPRTLSSSDSE